VVPPVDSRSGAFGTAAAVTHDRTVARLSIARTRQVTVTQIICGVDVSSSRLDAFVGPSGPADSFNNNAEGIVELERFCRQHRVELVAMEASGGYEQKAFGLLWAGGVGVTLLNPRSVRQFARGMGFLEKTDRLDARVIARYAEVKGSAPSVPASAEQRRLKALATRLRQLTALAAGQKNQRLLVSEPMVLESIGELLKVMTGQMRKLEAEIAGLLASDPLWQKLEEALRSIKGVAGRTVARVMADLPEIGTLSNKAVSKLAGVAPLAQDSGKREGARAVRGGRRDVRAILYVVAGVVRRHNADFAVFAERLAAKGKPRKVIRIALAHKLLIRLNARARDARKAFACAAAAHKGA
jgi:transposase